MTVPTTKWVEMGAGRNLFCSIQEVMNNEGKTKEDRRMSL